MSISAGTSSARNGQFLFGKEELSSFPLSKKIFSKTYIMATNKTQHFPIGTLFGKEAYRGTFAGAPFYQVTEYNPTTGVYTLKMIESRTVNVVYEQPIKNKFVKDKRDDKTINAVHFKKQGCLSRKPRRNEITLNDPLLRKNNGFIHYFVVSENGEYGNDD